MRLGNKVYNSLRNGLRWGAYLRQPDGYCRSYRPGGPPFGHLGIRRAQLPNRSGPTAGLGTEREPVRIICVFAARISGTGR